MEIPIKKACITGPRLYKLPWKNNENHELCIFVKNWLESQVETLINNNYFHFYCGMAEGIDMIFSEILLQLQKKYGGIRIEAVVPFEKQPDKWVAEQQKRYYNLLEKVDKITVINEEFSMESYFERNCYMVNNSDTVIAVIASKFGGTIQTINYAQKQNKNIIKLSLI